MFDSWIKPIFGITYVNLGSPRNSHKDGIRYKKIYCEITVQKNGEGYEGVWRICQTLIQVSCDRERGKKEGKESSWAAWLF